MKKYIANNGKFPLSKAILHDEKYTLEISGQIGIDKSTGNLAEGIQKQTIQIFENVKTILDEIGWKLNNIVKIRVYLSDMNDYSKMNEIYEKYFEKDYPTRVALAVKELPSKALIEIECVASGTNIKN